MRKYVAIILLLALGACSGAGNPGGWDQFAYVNPTAKMALGPIKTLESPGIY